MHIAHETAGAARTRSSLRPPLREQTNLKNSRKMMRRDRGLTSRRHRPAPARHPIPAFPMESKTLYGAVRSHRDVRSITYRYQRLGGSLAPLEGGLTRYISTRGEAC